MKWTTLTVADDTTCTGLTASSIASQKGKSGDALFPYIVDWSYLLDSDRSMVMRLNIEIHNTSGSDQKISQVLLTARADKTHTLMPAKLRPAWRGNARVRLDDRRLYDICRNDEVLTLPVSVRSDAVVRGWLAFVVDSDQVELIRWYKWCALVIDQSGKRYQSKTEQDRSICLELKHETLLQTLA